MSEDIVAFELPDGVAADLSFGVVAARFNKDLVDALVSQVTTALQGAGVPNDNVTTIRVPGSNEIPYAVNMLGMSGEVDCIIAVGVVIAGDTNHHDVIAASCATALHNISIELEIPIINGIITTNNIEQAKDRITGKYQRGVAFANAALEMANTASRFSKDFLEMDLDIEDL